MMRLLSFDMLVSVIFVLLMSSVFLTGCVSDKSAKQETEEVGEAAAGHTEPAIEEAGEFTPGDANIEDKKTVPDIEVIVDDAGVDIVPDEDEGGDGGGENLRSADNEGGGMDAELSEEDHAEEEMPKQAAGIVWIGDSLTQGSLGDIDDNLENAPYVRLGKLCKDRGNIVEGFGYYAFVTHDIFWRYGYDRDNEGIEAKDPEKVYVLWVGSNDFALSEDPLSEVQAVEAQIDQFVGDELNQFIVLSHLPRAETKPDGLYQKINQALQAYYGVRFLDITSCAPVPDGFQADEVHLTQSSYDKVADKVYGKLLEMGYI